MNIRTIKARPHFGGSLLLLLKETDSNPSVAVQMSATSDGSTEPNIYFAPLGAKCKSSPAPKS